MPVEVVPTKALIGPCKKNLFKSALLLRPRAVVLAEVASPANEEARTGQNRELSGEIQ